MDYDWTGSEDDILFDDDAPSALLSSTHCYATPNAVIPENMVHDYENKTVSSSDQELDDALLDVLVQHTVLAINQRANATCDGCRINHPSQVQHMLGCLASFDDKVDMHLQDVLDTALSRLFGTWSTSPWRSGIQQHVLATDRGSPYYHAGVDMY